MANDDGIVPGTPDERDVVAGELALGVLEGDERAAALRRTLADPEFAQAVDRWQHRLAPMLDTLPAVDPPADLWRQIAARIGDASSAALARWRAGALVASAIAACLAAVIVLRPEPPVPTPVQAPLLLAQVQGEAGPIVTARYDTIDGRLHVRTANLPTGALVPELWVIGSDATPRSLGLVALNRAGVYTLTATDRARLADGATLAITLEPQTQGRHDAPSTPVLGTARLTSI
ncbi:anti-sigma factor [Sphingomonas sp. RS2018]